MGEDFLPLKGYDHVELYVGNARQAAHFYEKVFGFRPVAKSGLETGIRDRACYVMEQGVVRLVFTSAYRPDHEIARHCALHGDGVKSIGLSVADVEQALAETRKRGATVLQPATVVKDDGGTFVTGTIKYAGDTVFRFVDRSRYGGLFAPGFRAIESPACASVGLAAIDHIVTNVHLGEMNFWANWFERIMGFRNLLHFSDKDISTEYSALMSKVVENGTGKIKFPINEPAEGKKKSQIDEYLDFYCGPGVQHIAMNTADICATVERLRSRGLDFLRVPDTYYDALPERVGEIDQDYRRIRELGILVDRDDDGYLLQIFTQPVQDRPTLFFEVIERHGSRGFGIGNFKALFVSLEREQALRGNL
ncbi:MAG: 4-hydroxyphenylpyruvate dioxygenase [Phycisphaerales bacterium]|nr:4-hydroxyphenylpyruvate dioxygenase [Phycisphaerales bacterium]